MDKYTIRIIIEEWDDCEKAKEDFGGWLIGSFNTRQEAQDEIEWFIRINNVLS